MVTREEFLGVELCAETVDVPGLGPVTVQELSQDEYADWVADWWKGNGGAQEFDNAMYCASLIQRSCRTAAGALLFTREDLPMLARRPARITRPLIRAAERLNGIGAEAMRDAKKNSDGGQDGSISTSSPATSGSGT